VFARHSSTLNMPDALGVPAVRDVPHVARWASDPR
jgi:hypothetical protein